jgi:N-succinyldiaminopimelate aminotransferase
MNPDLELLQSYPFEKLRQLFKDLRPPTALDPISLGIGEPQHPAPDFVVARLTEHLPLLAKYPSTRGLPELRQSIASWLQQRFQLAGVDAETQVLPVAGTREALFAIAQAVCDRSREPLVMCPNPFYQIYEGATLLAGARPHFLDCRPETGFLPDFNAVSAEQWQRCQLLYLCNPGNPTGAVIPLQTLTQLVELAQQHDFVIASDECYSEIYRDEDQPPPGLLQACHAAGIEDFHNCVVFHSLSKRSNLPGLRSGFVAGDAAIMDRFLLYRTYQGCALPLPHQWASVAAWSDEEHVRQNRALYREKFTAVLKILDGHLPVELPDAGFYLWPRTPGSDTSFARDLYVEQHLTVLPGSFLGRDSGAGNPGDGHVRMALVAPLEQCIESAQRIVQYCEAR